MAARRVSPRFLMGAVIVSLGAAAATFQLKDAVRNLEGELRSVQAQIAREHWALQAKQADFAFLTRPERLVMQAAQLGLVPARGGRLVQVSQIPPWQQLHWAGTPMLATLPSGAEVPLRLKPMALMAWAGLSID